LCGRNMEPISNISPVGIIILCTDVGNANRYRYVILQTGHSFAAALCFLEVEVIANGKHGIFHYNTHSTIKAQS